MKDFLIFDFDGTLVDSMFYWDESTFYFMKQYGIVPPDNINQMIKEMSIQECCEYFRKQYGIEQTPREMFAKANEYMFEKYNTVVPLKDNARAALDAFRAHGCRMCVATATDREIMSGAFKRLGLNEYFEFIITCGEIGVSKMKPDIYHYCADKFGAKPHDIAVFEDMPHCAVTAKKAGYYTVGVYDRHAAELEQEMRGICDIFLDDWNDYTKLIAE